MSRQKDMVGTGIAVIVAISLVLLLTAYLLVPVGLASLQGTSQATYNQSVGETVSFTGDVNATLDSVDTVSDPSTATVTLNDTDNAGSITNTIDNGSSATYALAEGNVNASVAEVGSGYAVITYEYPGTYNLGSGTTVLLSIIGLIGVLALLLLFIGWGIDRV